MGIFGWSLPPGCGTLPGEEDMYCEICGKTDTNCICPECPECGEVGNPECYGLHGMVRTQEQTDSMRKAEEQQFVDSLDEKDFQWKR